MKKIFLGILMISCAISCQKIEEVVNNMVSDGKQKVEQKANEAVKETVNEQLKKYVNTETIKFDSIFPHENSFVIENESGKKVAFPNGTPFYIFKYKVSDKDALLKSLVEQPTTDEAKSKKDFEKLNGATIIEKITFFEKFLPKNSIDLSFLNSIKNDKTIEYYKVKRFPHSSTIIYNPKNNIVYQFVEVKK